MNPRLIIPLDWRTDLFAIGGTGRVSISQTVEARNGNVQMATLESQPPESLGS